MYHCTDCGAKFLYAEVVYETLGLDTPPYKRILRCPACHSDEIEEKEEYHCNFCGAKLREKGKYCSDRCREAGERYYAAEAKNREIFSSSPLAAAVREVDEYNKTHGTKYSYGQYFMLKDTGGLK